MSGGSRPGRPKLRPGSRTLMRTGLRHGAPHAPDGRAVGLPAHGLARTWTASRTWSRRSRRSGEWSPHPNVWIVTMDYDTGRAGRLRPADAPEAPLSLAVQASCSIPAWYAPVDDRRPPVRRRRGVVGDLRRPGGRHGLDEVYVIAPDGQLPHGPSRPPAGQARADLAGAGHQAMSARGREGAGRRHGRHRDRTGRGGPGGDRARTSWTTRSARTSSRPRSAPRSRRCAIRTTWARTTWCRS